MNGMFLLWQVLAIAAPERIALGDVDARGCGTPVLDGARRVAAAPGLCVRRVLTAHLEAPELLDVVLVVAKEGRDRLFVYRLENDRLVPRFLGSGPRDLDLLDVRAEHGALAVEVGDAAGARKALRCRFDGFPLVCTEVAR